ncbi:colicin transporter [Rahnella victoriana]|nr:colicin transporter [Rahnella victoriana]
MGNKLLDHEVLYVHGEDFFKLNGNASMKLSPKAAIEVCHEAAKKNLWVLGIDGGHWMNPGFQIDGAASWTYNKPDDYQSKLSENIKLAIENIKSDETEGYTAFLVTLSD